ncbi:MAG: urease accessory protein UreD [Isosphaeraceae bacterium]|nr:urease accessory protein UreD [Isosphaeraceae bacterium]
MPLRTRITRADFRMPLRARITRADFPPPPELADRDPGAAPTEHIGGLRAELRWRDGQLHLGRTYQQNPLRVLVPISERPGTPTLLFLLNSTAGLLDGDGQWVDLDVGPGVRAFLTSQAAGRVHPCPLGHAAVRFDLRLAADSVLCLLPGPTIPFAGSRYHQRAEIHLEPGAHIVWGDILLPGRTQYARAPERFAFDRLVQELRVYREGRLVFLERFAWSGPWDEAEIRWHFGDAEAAASLFLSGPPAAVQLPELPDGEVAVQETAFGDTCVRLLGRDPERLIAAAARVALTAAARLAGDPEPWLLDSPHLVANHWFSPPPGP